MAEPLQQADQYGLAWRPLPTNQGRDFGDPGSPGGLHAPEPADHNSQSFLLGQKENGLHDAELCNAGKSIRLRMERNPEIFVCTDPVRGCDLKQ
jgi:hypothetical protein